MDPNAGLEPTGADNDGQVPSATPQTGGASQTTPQEGAPSQAGSKPIADLASALDIIKELRDENAKRRKNEKALGDSVKQYQDASKTAEQKAQEELDSLRTYKNTNDGKLRELLIDNAVARALAGMDAHDPDIVADQLKKLVALDEETGLPTKESLEAARLQLKEEKPFLFKQPAAAPAEKEKPKATSAGGSTNLPRTQEMTLEAISKMPYGWINEHWEDVQAVLRKASPQVSNTPGNSFAYLNPMNGE